MTLQRGKAGRWGPHFPTIQSSYASRVAHVLTPMRRMPGFGFDMVGPQASGPGSKGEPVGIFVSRVFKGGAADLVGRRHCRRV